MNELTDVHCHILPGLDDGAKSRGMMEEMMTMAYQNGMTAMIATSHYNPVCYHYTKRDYMQRLMLAQIVASDVSPRFRVYSGNEIFYRSEQTLEALKSGDALTLADSDYVLTEFAPFQNFDFIKNAVSQLVVHGYFPIIAHVERYECLHENMDRVEELRRNGAFIQVNASHLMGNTGHKMKTFIQKLLKKDAVHFIATDAHNTSNRAPEIKSCAAFVAKKYGMDMYRRIFLENPQAIIQKQLIEN